MFAGSLQVHALRHGFARKDTDRIRQAHESLAALAHPCPAAECEVAPGWPQLLLLGYIGRRGSMELVSHYDGHGLAIRRDSHFAYGDHFAVALVGFLNRVADPLERHAGCSRIAHIDRKSTRLNSSHANI